MYRRRDKIVETVFKIKRFRKTPFALLVQLRECDGLILTIQVLQAGCLVFETEIDPLQATLLKVNRGEGSFWPPDAAHSDKTTPKSGDLPQYGKGGR
jgi:hypothetical protein